MIFSHVLDSHLQVNGVRYAAFLIPGLVMMSILQNAFANTSSSLIQSKVTGSIVFVLLPPISYVEFFLAYVVAAAADVRHGNQLRRCLAGVRPDAAAVIGRSDRRPG